MSPCDPGRHVLFGSNLKKEGESAKQVKNRGQVPAEAWCAPAGRSPCPPWLPETCCSRPSRHPRASLCTCHLLGHTDRRPAVPSHASSRVSGQVQLRSSRRVGWHARVLCQEHARGCSGSCRPRIRGSRGCSSSRPRGAGSENRSNRDSQQRNHVAARADLRPCRTRGLCCSTTCESRPCPCAARCPSPVQSGSVRPSWQPRL